MDILHHGGLPFEITASLYCARLSIFCKLLNNKVRTQLPDALIEVVAAIFGVVQKLFLATATLKNV
jgi:hypothetical protein